MSEITGASLPVEIVWAETADRAGELAADGYEPIECAFGEVSVLGQFAMDHHGRESDREGVAIRAYRDHFAAHRCDPRFAVTGAADADACFAIAALIGQVPHPSRDPELGSVPGAVRRAGTRDLIELAELINRIDVDPIGVRLDESDHGRLLLLWNRLASNVQDATAFHAGVDRWRALLRRAPAELLVAIGEGEESRVHQAREAEVTPISEHVAMVDSSVWGFGIWYAEVAPVVVAFLDQPKAITVGCVNKETAERLFGSGGLRNVFPTLAPPGWGGREAIGGSPRGVALSRREAVAAARHIAAMAAQPQASS